MAEHPLPLHLKPISVAVVGLGGAVGTGLRAAVTRAGSAHLATPYVTLVINLVGAFLLGVLLESLARRGPDRGRRQRLRLLLGTGVLGGFTTYSSLAVDVATLGGRGQLGAAALVALGTLMLGAVATTLGILAGSRRASSEVEGVG